jgi:hypothetical protein
VVDFVAGETPDLSPERELGGLCKTRSRVVVTLAEGSFRAREHLREGAEEGGPLVGSTALTRVVPPRQRYGYDLIVHVGLQRYLAGQQRDEIRGELRTRRGIRVSAGTITNLCNRFLVLLEMLHLVRAPVFRAVLEGAWSLHLDATCDRGRGGLLIGLEGFRGWVLAATRIATEHGDAIRPLVEQIVALFGTPLATMRDLGEAMADGVRPLAERGIPDLVCHTHFLRAVGEKLLDTAYSRLRLLLRGCRVRSDLRGLLREARRLCDSDGLGHPDPSGPIRRELLALLHWILEGEGTKEPPFPFALHHRDFARRCQQAQVLTERWIPSPRTAPERQLLHRMATLLGRLRRDPRVEATLDEIERAWDAFVELRTVLRCTHLNRLWQDHEPGQLDFATLDFQRLQEIERDVRDYQETLRYRLGSASPRTGVPDAVILRYLRRYGDHLFGHPVVRDDDGTILAVVHRTNNPPEHFFGSSKQRLRRRVGRAHLGRDMQDQPAQAALVPNLRHPDYVRLLCGSLDNLPEAFADLSGRGIPEGLLQRDRRDGKLQRLVRQLLRDHEQAPSCRKQLAQAGRSDRGATVS